MLNSSIRVILKRTITEEISQHLENLNSIIQQIYTEMLELQPFLPNDEQMPKMKKVLLDFTYLPVDMLSKEFTKLNNPHRYRVHYLGPRFINTLTLHKKYSHNQQNQFYLPSMHKHIPKYAVHSMPIAFSNSINEKLKSNHAYHSGLYYRAFEGMNPSLDLSKQYQFNSAFEGGNLDCVIKTKPLEFDLFLRIDSNTRGHLQWFYFSIKNGKNMDKIRLNICNVSKSKTLYENGMQPYVFSIKGEGKWTQGSSALTILTLEQKQYQYEVLDKKNKPLVYNLSFFYQFQHADDEVFFCYSIPYSYSEMLADIKALPPSYVKQHSIGRSLTGLQIPLLHITDRSSNWEKKNIIITGRIHPGQSNGSHVLKGFLEFLCSGNITAIQMRKRANFLVIPMINPDGVVLGNTRSSAAGRDMNRMFIDPDQQLFPQIFCFKRFVNRFLNAHQIFIYYDFHGHSRRKNTFMYGPSYPIINPNYYKCRILPRLIQKKNNGFRYYSCTFNISEEKKTTGRATMFENFAIPYTYTIETSIGLYYDPEKMKTLPFDIGSWKKMGSSICQGTCSFLFGFQQYENIIKEKRALREKKKMQKFNKSKKSMISSENQSQEKVEPFHKITYKNQVNVFLQTIEEIKKMNQEKNRQVSVIDEEVSSDDHDEKEDLDSGKFNQFKNSLIQNGQKEIPTKKSQKNILMEEWKQTGKNNRFQRHNKRQGIKQNEQMDLMEEFFQESNNKPRSSSGNRKYYMHTNRSSTSMNKKRVNVEKKEDNETLDAPSQFHISIAKRKNNMSLREAIRQANKLNHRKQKRQLKTYSQKVNHFSELLFPETQKNQEKKSIQKFNSNNNGFFQRKSRDGKRLQKNDLLAKLSEVSMEKTKYLEEKVISAKNKFATEFKFEQIMGNIQLKSKMVKNSVKYRKQKQSKNKNTFAFPSSFYGVQQQHTQKRRPDSLDEGIKTKKIKLQEENANFWIKKYF